MFRTSLTLQRSIVIQRPIADVFSAIADFKIWSKWSPWQILEPSCKVQLKGAPQQVGHEMFWDGKRIGSGSMTLSQITPGKYLNIDLQFLTPWKSHSTASFSLEDLGGKTKVTWDMKGSLPIFMFFFKKMMQAWIGNDYDRGLKMLADFLERGKVDTKLDFPGIQAVPEVFFIAKQRSCSLMELPTFMGKDFSDVVEFVRSHQLPTPKYYFSIYDKFDLVAGRCDYRACAAFDSLPASAGGLDVGALPAHKSYQIIHTGPYRHLGNAWSALMGCVRHEKLKSHKSLPMYEIYRNMPGQVPDEQLVTEVNQPIRGNRCFIFCRYG